MEIEGRKIYLATGSNTRTINICDASNLRGHYDWRIRFSAPPWVTRKELQAFNDLPTLLHWLSVVAGGYIDIHPPYPEEVRQFKKLLLPVMH